MIPFVSGITSCISTRILQKYAEFSQAPLLINSCEVDQMFPISAQEEADKILGGGKFAPGYERTYWPGCVHGFAVRGDLVSCYDSSLDYVECGSNGLILFDRANPRSRRVRRARSKRTSNSSSSIFELFDRRPSGCV